MRNKEPLLQQFPVILAICTVIIPLLVVIGMVYYGVFDGGGHWKNKLSDQLFLNNFLGQTNYQRWQADEKTTFEFNLYCTTS